MDTEDISIYHQIDACWWGTSVTLAEIRLLPPVTHSLLLSSLPRLPPSPLPFYNSHPPCRFHRPATRWHCANVHSLSTAVFVQPLTHYRAPLVPPISLSLSLSLSVRLFSSVSLAVSHPRRGRGGGDWGLQRYVLWLNTCRQWVRRREPQEGRRDHPSHGAGM